MKIIAIALKDLWRAFRSFFALAFMFGVPILMTVMFAFLFGGIGDEDSEFNLPETDVLVVNHDQGSALVSGFSAQGEEFSKMSDMLLDTLQQDTFEDIMSLNTTDEREARTAVDEQQADMAMIIPKNFTNALIGESKQPAQIEFYQSAEDTIGGETVQSIVMSLIDRFSSGVIIRDSVTAIMKNRGIYLSEVEKISLLHDLSSNTAYEQTGSQNKINIIKPSDIQTESNQESPLQTILRSIMAGMMIFYAFFTGTSAAQTILQEQENGTLARLFTSPTSITAILNGKFLAGFVMIIVQVSTLLLFANLVFGINWGPILPLMFSAISLVALANSFGIFLMSLVKGTKQAGIIYGAVLTFTGMLGISSVFVIGTPIEKTFNYLPLIVPQGWAMNAFKASWKGDLNQVLILASGMIILAMIFFSIGNARFTKRFN
jgi:ABC-2 type transport system permease protein